MMLSDITIGRMLESGLLGITPKPQPWQMQPASVDLTLGGEMMSPYADIKTKFGKVYTIMPGECVLGTTREKVSIPPNLVGRVEGKSTWGRKFLMVHSTAGFIDPGFTGQITLEFMNLSKVSLVVEVGQPIAQISFCYTDRVVGRPYGSPGLNSHYQGQKGVTASV